MDNGPSGWLGGCVQSEDDGQGGRRKKKGITQKVKEKLPGGRKDHQPHDTTATTTTPGAGGGYGSGYSGGDQQHPEKKGVMEKIKEKLPGTGHN